MIETLSRLVADHPDAAVAVVFLLALGETIAVLGLFLPTTPFLVAAGIAAGAAHAPAWPLLMAAAWGAFIGNALSYEAGRRYQQRIRGIWPFATRPALLAQGQKFFEKHGAKGVIVGRFVPAGSCLVPLVAGMLHMRRARFYLFNLLAVALWAPTIILAGTALGSWLDVLIHLGSRPWVWAAVGLVAGILLLRYLLPRALPLLIEYRTSLHRRLDTRPSAWAQRLGRFIDPRREGSTRQILLGALLMLVSAAFVKLAGDVSASETAGFDHALLTGLQGLHSESLDTAMLLATLTADGRVITVVTLACVGWLLWRRCWRQAAGFAVVMLLVWIGIPVLKLAMAIVRPNELYIGYHAFSFPSGHSTSAAALWAMVAWLTAMGSRGRFQWIAMAGAGLLIGAVAVSRVLLGAHWPSDVVAGVLLGLSLALMFALFTDRPDAGARRFAALGWVAVLVWLGMGGWHVATNYPAARSFYGLPQS